MFAGACFMRSACFGLALFALVLIVPWRWQTHRMAGLSAAFLFGAVMVLFVQGKAQPMPRWAAMPGKTVLAEGEVDAVSGLAGGRARVLLKNVRRVAAAPELPAPLKEKLQRQLERLPAFEGTGFPKGYGAGVSDSDGPVPGLVALTLDDQALQVAGRPVQGQILRAAMRLFPAGGSLNEHCADSRSYWVDRNVWCSARIAGSGRLPLWLECVPGRGLRFMAAQLREKWRSRLIQALSAEGGPQNAAWYDGVHGQARAMIPALLFGDRSFLSPHTADLFTAAGLIHSLALSGQHLALAAFAGMALVWLCSLIFLRMYLHAPRLVWTAVAGLPFALCYLYLGGAPFSLLRAACMMAAGAALICLRRAAAPLDALFFAAGVLFLCWPPAVFDLSAQYSFLAVAGIMLAMPVAGYARQMLKSRPGCSRAAAAAVSLVRWAVMLMLFSCAAQIAVFPVQSYVFGAVAPCFWLNVLWLPLLTFVTLPCAALGMACQIVGVGNAGSLFFTVAAMPAEFVLGFLEWLNDAGALPMVQTVRLSPVASLGFAGCLAALAFALQGKMDKKAFSPGLRRLFASCLHGLTASRAPARSMCASRFLTLDRGSPCLLNAAAKECLWTAVEARPLFLTAARAFSHLR